MFHGGARAHASAKPACGSSEHDRTTVTRMTRKRTVFACGLILFSQKQKYGCPLRDPCCMFLTIRPFHGYKPRHVYRRARQADMIRLRALSLTVVLPLTTACHATEHDPSNQYIPVHRYQALRPVEVRSAGTVILEVIHVTREFALHAQWWACAVVRNKGSKLGSPNTRTGLLGHTTDRICALKLRRRAEGSR